MRRTISLALAAVLIAAPAWAQEGHSRPDHGGMASAAEMPDGWLMRLDRANATPDMASFQIMAPGWHVTTAGRGAEIFWQPTMVGKGQYRVETAIHLMKPAQHAEAFGVFVGGTDLDAANQRYVYFLVRQTGEYLIKRRDGDGTENIVGWTAHDAVPSAKAEGSTRYELAVDVGARDVTFLVNGTAVHTMPKSALHTDGVAGLRINHMLDTHIEKLVLEQK